MLFIEPTGGLCNRMRALNSALFLADKARVPLTLVWRVTWDMGSPVTKLFRLPSFINFIEYNHPENNFEPAEKVDRFIDQAELSNLFYGHYPMEKLFETHQTIYMRTCGFVYQYQHFNYFKPIVELQKVIDDYVSTFNQNVIGIHIRRTDNENAVKYSNTEDFIAAMEFEISKSPQINFYLATDSPEVENLLLKKFGGRIIVHPKELRRDTVKGIQDALVDLYCLANTKKLLASYWSSFSDIAAEIKNIEKQVIYRG